MKWTGETSYQQLSQLTLWSPRISGYGTVKWRSRESEGDSCDFERLDYKSLDSDFTNVKKRFDPLLLLVPEIIKRILQKTIIIVISDHCISLIIILASADSFSQTNNYPKVLLCNFGANLNCMSVSLYRAVVFLVIIPELPFPVPVML